MSAPTQSRERVLAAIRAATREAAADSEALAAAYTALPRDYVRRGKLDNGALIATMIERLRGYDAEVVECTPEQLRETIDAQLRAAGKRTVVAPRETETAWLVPGVDWLIDRELSADQIEDAEGVLTAAFCAIADSGTIVLHHSGAEGRRILSLLPDWHLLILRASQVVETLPEYFDRCEQPPSLVTFISGPSATADIEMTRIKGVHGPRFMVVILVRDA